MPPSTPLCFLLQIITLALNWYWTPTQHFSTPAPASKAPSSHHLKDLLLYGVHHIQPTSKAMRISCNGLDEPCNLKGGRMIYAQFWSTVLQYWAELRKDTLVYVSLVCEIQHSLEHGNTGQAFMFNVIGTGHQEIGELGAVLTCVNTKKSRVRKMWLWHICTYAECHWTILSYLTLYKHSHLHCTIMPVPK